MSVDEFYANPEWFADVTVSDRSWMFKFLEDARSKNFDGWLNPRALEMVLEQKVHEIASHGFRHIPLRENLISRDDYFKEFELIEKWSALKGIKLKTFIFPINLIGFLDEFKKSGFTGYRDGVIGNPQSRVLQLKKLLSEFNVFASSQECSNTETPVRIPSGFF